EQLGFIKEQTGIQDPEALKKHVLAIQAKAYALYDYPCIRTFDFVRYVRRRIHIVFVLKHRRSRISTFNGAILLDLGCCFGTDIRQAASDGFPVQNLIAIDIHPEFWKLGHELFRSTPETFPVTFLVGDALDPDFLEPTEPIVTPTEVALSAPPLTSLTSLTPLRGHVAAIHISFLFHLLPETQQRQLVCAVAGLLSPVHGSVIFGSHVGMREKGSKKSSFGSTFCHSPESWREMWEEMFPKGRIRVDAELQRRRVSDPPNVGFLVWSVTRV
ncbi:hypothetical protein FB451DRAFT_1047325, partial [Mycena latifolia]